MDWMIYPATKAFIRICSVVFGAGSILVAILHILIPSLPRFPEQAVAGTWAILLSILSLACIVLWGSRVLLAARGNYVTRVLSSLSILAALYALLIPLTAQPVSFQYAEMGRTWEMFLLLAAVTAFFAFPYTRGYPTPARKLFLAWGILAACNALQGVLFLLFLLLWGMLSELCAPLAAVLPYAIILFSCGLDAALAVLSAVLAWTLFQNVMGIASLPDLQNPEMPRQKE